MDHLLSKEKGITSTNNSQIFLMYEGVQLLSYLYSVLRDQNLSEKIFENWIIHNANEIDEWNEIRNTETFPKIILSQMYDFTFIKPKITVQTISFGE